jgi:hypothetical protein
MWKSCPGVAFAVVIPDHSEKGGPDPAPGRWFSQVADYPVPSLAIRAHVRITGYPEISDADSEGRTVRRAGNFTTNRLIVQVAGADIETDLDGDVQRAYCLLLVCLGYSPSLAK